MGLLVGLFASIVQIIHHYIGIRGKVSVFKLVFLYHCSATDNILSRVQFEKIVVFLKFYNNWLPRYNWEYNWIHSHFVYSLCYKSDFWHINDWGSADDISHILCDRYNSSQFTNKSIEISDFECCPIFRRNNKRRHRNYSVSNSLKLAFELIKRIIHVIIF